MNNGDGTDPFPVAQMDALLHLTRGSVSDIRRLQPTGSFATRMWTVRCFPMRPSVRCSAFRRKSSIRARRFPRMSSKAALGR